MNIVERIKSNSLPTKQLRVIEAILDDLESNSFLSGHELCEKFDISFSSLTRLAKSLQYSGFPELKKDIEKLYKTEFSPSIPNASKPFDSQLNCPNADSTPPACKLPPMVKSYASLIHLVG